MDIIWNMVATTLQNSNISALKEEIDVAPAV